nr:MAG TPA: hypothetical protein [Caudoviricetes sp.]
MLSGETQRRDKYIIPEMRTALINYLVHVCSSNRRKH